MVQPAPHSTIDINQNPIWVMDSLSVGSFAYGEPFLFLKGTIPFKGAREALNIFLSQNKGKGPPGGWCSPESGSDPLSDSKPGSLLRKQKQSLKLKQIKQYQFSNLFHN